MDELFMYFTFFFQVSHRGFKWLVAFAYLNFFSNIYVLHPMFNKGVFTPRPIN